MAPKRKCDCGTCERCIKREYMNMRYRTDPEFRERVRANANASRARRIEEVREYDRQRGFRETDKNKIKARNATRALDRSSQSCEVCGTKPADAHHDDYSKHLEVRWLCEPHHAEAHRRYKEVKP